MASTVAASLTFVSQSALKAEVGDRLGLDKRIAAMQGWRTAKKIDMVHNGWRLFTGINAQTCRVRADGELLTCEPATVLPLAQSYFLF